MNPQLRPGGRTPPAATDPDVLEAAGELLRRHDAMQPEANLTSAARDLLVAMGFFGRHELSEEIMVGGRPVDLTGGTHIFETKRRVGLAGTVDPENLEQLDDYLDASATEMPQIRCGILLDGRTWVLRYPGQRGQAVGQSDVFRLDQAQKWNLLYEWLAPQFEAEAGALVPTVANIAARLGSTSHTYRVSMDRLREFYGRAPNPGSIEVKQELWREFMAAALGEAGEEASDTELFLRHTYLSATVGAAIHFAFGLDAARIAREATEDLLNGVGFFNQTAIHGAINQGFFTWPAEVEGFESWLVPLVEDVGQFDWSGLDEDFARLLYETVISPEERRDLGEYYTPQWLADAMVEESITDPLTQSVLDPACGSGTFLNAALRRYIEAARAAGVPAPQMLDWMVNNIVGIDVHPIAVLLARTTWLFSILEVLAEARRESESPDQIAVPVYLGDSLQVRTGYRGDQMFGESAVVPIRSQTGGKRRELRFPVALVEMGDWFDDTMLGMAREIDRGGDPVQMLLHDSSFGENEDLIHTARVLQELHEEGRNHIWAYYARNLVRPIALAARKVDVIVGNPPWINYNQTDGLFRDQMKDLSRAYEIWAGGRYATHQDIAGLFFTRCTDLYLGEEGRIGFVLPHSALQTGQWSAWRRGKWAKATRGRTLLMDMGAKAPWDLEALEPNTFFPVPSCVVFGRIAEKATFARVAERWRGPAGGEMARDEERRLLDTSRDMTSPYGGRSRQGATLVPRRLLFVEPAEGTSAIRPAGTQVTKPRRGRYDKAPYKDLPLNSFHGMTVESEHVFDIHLGETLAPYVTLDPLRAVLPVRKSLLALAPAGDVGGIDPYFLEERVRDRWKEMAGLWDANKKSNDEKSLLERIDFFGNLSSQFQWMSSNQGQVRVAYGGSGEPTAAILPESRAIADYTTFWIACDSPAEAGYVLAIVNSGVLKALVEPLMPKGQFGSRHLQKHLWRLPIPEFDPDSDLHQTISTAGVAAANGAAAMLAELRKSRESVSTRIARNWIRKWLAESSEGWRVESLVGELLHAD